jgi:protein phosphatase
MRLLLLVAVLAVAGGGSIAAYGWSQRQYYVGADGGSVAIFRGVDQKLAWVSLSRVEERAPIPLDALPTFHRNQVDSSIAALSLEDARRIVSNLQDQADACAKQGTAVTTPPARPPATPAATPPPAGPPSARVAPTPGPGVTGLTPSRPATPAPSRAPRLDCTGAQP